MNTTGFFLSALDWREVTQGRQAAMLMGKLAEARRHLRRERRSLQEHQRASEAMWAELRPALPRDMVLRSTVTASCGGRDRGGHSLGCFLNYYKCALLKAMSDAQSWPWPSPTDGGSSISGWPST